MLAVLALMFCSISHQANANEMDIGAIGFTFHTMVNQAAANAMPLKLDSTGRIVFNPQLNITVHDSGWIYNATILEDCYADPAYFTGFGKEWSLGFVKFAMVLGVFMRYHNDISTPSIFVIDHSQYDVIPMPFMTVQKSIPISGQWGISIMAASNYILNELIFGVSREI